MNIHFQKAAIPHKDLIFDWLEEPHMQEFWDNSPEHKEDILLFMGGRQTPSSYFKGTFSYWVGFFEKSPFCFILTSEISDAPENPPLWNTHLSKDGKTYSLDFGIGNKDFLGKGLAAPTLSAFCTFFKDKVDPLANTFFIDPDENNPKAKHVYSNAGFKEMGTFEVSTGFFQGHKSPLMVKKI